MALYKLVFKPGINRDQTNYASEGGWYEMDKVRFRSGFPEKLGGWEHFNANNYVGISRNLFNWITSDGANLLSVTTNKKVYVEAGDNLYDITPIRATFVFESNPITGVSATSALGTVTTTTVNNISATGEAGTASVGDVTVDIV